jgi:hypothetical protein
MNTKLLLFASALLLLTSACNTDGPKSKHNTTQYNNDGSIKAIWDVPALLNGSIEDATSKLGTGTEVEYPNLAINTKTWHNGDYYITLDYKTSSRRVTSAFIGKNRPLSDWQALLYIGSLIGKQGYNTKPVASLQNPSKYTGLEVAKR